MEFYRYKKGRKGSRKILVLSIMLYFLFYRALYAIVSDFRIHTIVSGLLLVALFAVNAYLVFGRVEYERVRARVICESKVSRWKVLKVKFKSCPLLTLILTPFTALFIWTGLVVVSNLPLLLSLFAFYLFLLLLVLYGLAQNSYIITEKGVADANSRTIVFWSEIGNFEVRGDILLLYSKQRKICNDPIPLAASEEIFQIIKN